MRISGQKIVSALILIQIALFFTGISVSAFDLRETGRGACCDHDADAAGSAEFPCPAAGCLCMSCMSLLPVQSSHVHNALTIEASTELHPDPFHVPEYISSIEHPPKTV